MSKLFEFNFSSISDFSWSERTGETKLWQEMNFGKPNSHNKFLILGINEDFGPQLNFGNAGAKNGFKTTIEKLGNQASNSFLYALNLLSSSSKSFFLVSKSEIERAMFVIIVLS